MKPFDVFDGSINNEKVTNAILYWDEQFKNIKNKKINIIEYSKNSVFHQYVILVQNRNNLIKLLKQNNIQYGIHYPISINKLNCFKNLFKNKKFINSEFIASNCLSLPIDPNLTLKDQKKICLVLNSY